MCYLTLEAVKRLVSSSNFLIIVNFKVNICKYIPFY